MEIIYTVDYFIKKFEAIPSKEIGTSQDTGCAYGQCRTMDKGDGAITVEGMALEKLMMTLPELKPSKAALYPPYECTPARINNGEILQYQQRTPKERILAALRDIKAMQDKEVVEPPIKEQEPVHTEYSKEVKEKIRYVSVPSSITEQTKELIYS